MCLLLLTLLKKVRGDTQGLSPLRKGGLMMVLINDQKSRLEPTMETNLGSPITSYPVSSWVAYAFVMIVSQLLIHARMR